MVSPTESINQAEPLIMHIDLNSCFAMVEQQANPFLRGKPVAMTNRLTRNATVIAASYEAKRLGIGVGTKLAEAKQLAPGIVVLETDPAKYVYAYHTFMDILTSYSPDAYMKSIDEGVIDFSSLRLLYPRPLTEIGLEIKAKLKQKLGKWMTCNVGIAPNRFLAKLAASLHKPDGLDVIDARNLLTTYSNLQLMDFHGIKHRYQARLNAAGIFSPLEFFFADEQLLTKQVFKSINGYYWYMRLRGWEIDDAIWGMKTVGRQYVLHEFTDDIKKLTPTIMKMCEGTGRRMRAKGLCARGLFISAWLKEGGFWHARKTFRSRLFTTQEIYTKALCLFNQRPPDVIKSLSISCYGLAPADTPQLSLFETADMRQWRLARAIDKMNNRYGDFSLVPATMAYTDHIVKTKIPFGSIRHFNPASIL